MAFSRKVTISSPGAQNGLTPNFADLLPTEGDMMYAIQRHRTRILLRTQAGVDYEGQQFADYNDTRPYYYYPNGPVGRISGGSSKSLALQKRQKASVSRSLRLLKSSRFIGTSDYEVTKSGLGIRFRSYKAFKFSYLGRTTVDLTGPRAPHMLQAFQATAGSVVSSGTSEIDSQSSTPATSGRLEIVGDAALRAAGHNSDTNRPKGMPQRKFMGASQQDVDDFGRDIETRVTTRLLRNYLNSRQP